MNVFPLLLTIYAGFAHAFEADHLLAVGNIVSRRDNIRQSLKDGIFWGLGHTSTILLIGILVLFFRINISAQYFQYLEALVGLMLIVLGIYRLKKLFPLQKIVIHVHPHGHEGDKHHQHLHMHLGSTSKHSHPHSLAYGIGLIHGLAGSGALIVMVMLQIKDPVDGIFYLIIFGIGSIGGMLIAAGLFSIPFSKRIMKAQNLQATLIIISALLCMGYGGLVIYKNLLM